MYFMCSYVHITYPAIKKQKAIMIGIGSVSGGRKMVRGASRSEVRRERQRGREKTKSKVPEAKN